MAEASTSRNGLLQPSEERSSSRRWRIPRGGWSWKPVDLRRASSSWIRKSKADDLGKEGGDLVEDENGSNLQRPGMRTTTRRENGGEMCRRCAAQGFGEGASGSYQVRHEGTCHYQPLAEIKHFFTGEGAVGSAEGWEVESTVVGGCGRRWRARSREEVVGGGDDGVGWGGGLGTRV